jgi:two-component system cell cycle sensor histidine kinase/response regulator CckA
MNTISMLPIIMASLMFYVGLSHFIIYSHQKEKREYLTFALSCFCVGLYSICCAGLYNVSSPIEGVQWQRYQVVALAVLGIALLWFISDYTGQTNRKVVMVFTIYYVFAAFLGMFLSGDMIWTNEPSIKEISLPFGYGIKYYEMVPGVLTNFQSIVGVIYFIYILKVSLKFYTIGNKQKGKPLLMAIAILFLGLVNDTLVSSGFYQFIYTLEYSYIGIILVFTYSLTKIVLRAGEIEIALRESEKRFRDLVEMLPIAVFETDINMKLTFANPFAFEIFGYSEAELANGINGLDLIAPPDHERVLSNFAMRFKGEDPGTVEYQAITKDGSIFYMLLRAASIVKDGEFHGIRGVIVDISDRKQAEKEREKLQSQLQQAQKMEAIGTLAGGIAHDFNNLLMGIQGRASLMSFDLESSHPCREHVNAIMDYSRSASGLTKQLLGVARGGKFEVKPMDLNEILSSSATMFGRTKKEIRIHTKLHNPTPVVMADRMQIEQVLLNLLVNAWQAMPQSGEIYLETSIVRLDETYCKPHSAAPGKYAKISVTDTGVGMDKGLLPQIFDPFFSTKRKGRGTGLGLASAYGIVKNHGGIITVYSEVGHGTTFNICLPLSDKTAENEETLTPAFIKGTETILLIDDEQMITEVGQTMLEKLGYRVFVANSGEDGIVLMNERGADIDLVILDMIMPGMDGGQTFDRIREIHSTIPVILSSGYSLNGQAEKIINRGCSGFIQKPFGLETLSRKVHEVMNQGKSDDQA